MHCFYSQMLKLSIAWQTEKKHFQDNGEQNKRIPNTPQRHIQPFVLWRTRHSGSLNNLVVSLRFHLEGHIQFGDWLD